MSDEKDRCTATTGVGINEVRCEQEAGHVGWHTYCGEYGGIGTPRCVYQTSWKNEQTVKVIES